MGPPEVRLAAVSLLALGGCFLSSDPPAYVPADAGADSRVSVPADGGPRCTLPSECSDGLFCTGREFCDPSDSRADGFGCVAGVPACRDLLVCTIESEPACNESTSRCGPVTLDHSRCPAGFFCQRTWGCTAAVPCPADGSACPPDDRPCTTERCDSDVDPPRCVADEVGDDTPCTNADGTTGLCLAGRCCLDCLPPAG